MRPLVVVLALLVAGSAAAQDGPSFDCAKASSSIEQMICADDKLASLDRMMAERYAEAISAIRGLDSGAEESESSLKVEQRGWIKGRDECWKADDQRACVEDAYLRREGELVAIWILEEPQLTAFWACGGNPSNEVVTVFFDTTRPSLRFERGDSIDAGTLVPTASGTRYDGSFGRFIWIKGEEATYRDPDPDGSEYSCVRAPDR